ncbi:PSD1 and planctomycete cytochrome C domain-containing protein [Alienimonas chondri]|uniref:Planctomycete cytochrome C n=1 Tax=Alienimonas chondri TaxID=2681879 RepID=A0ABX1VEX9_9PLAN|nr:PSD1 and planctomycete cytochrome C domain-containing protein [Alienimonas chondri]NNJ26284.1 hypothetical protein [Alienimonas chondri]
MPKSPPLVCLVLLAAAPVTASRGSAGAGEERVSFNRDVRPILSDRCYYCHGFDPNHREADLRLDVREEAERVWNVEAPDESELLARITSDDEYLVMPPPAAHKPAITPAEADLIRRWIAQGAEYEPHWAFTPPQRPDVPRIDGASHPIDAFIQRRLTRQELRPAGPAPPAQLLRRLSLDLIGLPPSPAEMTAFEDAYRANPDAAYGAAVDRLLASPHFGERMASEWLDVARYADTNGFQQDLVRTNWPWRDWVVGAFNENKPFDEFTIEQLAGDLLPGPDGTGPTTDQLVATAFNRNHMINGEGGSIAEENLAKYAFDRVETTSTAFLGLTVGCAQCHDHKFDPIRQADYYGLMAMFNQMDEPGGISKRWSAEAADGQPAESYGIAKPFVSLASEAQAARLADLHAEVTAARQALDAEESNYGPPFVAWVEEMRADESLIAERLTSDYVSRVVGTAPLDDLNHGETRRLLAAFLDSDPRWKPLRAAIRTAEDAEESYQARIPLVMVMRDDRPHDTFLLERGNYETPGAQVAPGVPAFLPPLPEGAEADRLALARWLVSGKNPLTARVIVNRYWQLLFGRALVDTPDDFGLQGALPSHPDLLDWLAVEFVESGWDVKRLLKTIVTSDAYRRTAQVDANQVAADPENRWYARGARHRLDSRIIRDSALAISGLLSPTLGGPPVKPYQPPGVWEEMSLGKNKFVQSTGEGLRRRSLYTFWRRVVGPTNFFDTPARQVCAVTTLRTSTPLHALTLLNDTTYTEAARVWAATLLGGIRDGQFDGSQFDEDCSAVTHAFFAATGRRPSEAEADLLTDALADARTRFAAEPVKAAALLAVGEAPRDESLDANEQAAWTSVCLLILNLDEAISKP